ncbi:MAG: serine/threonine-protein kinase [Fuerstiella sp.]
MSEQSEYVRTACSGDDKLITEVESLLSAFEGGARELEASPVAKALAKSPTDSPLPPTDSIPGYKILKELHRGGQGVVYQAIQQSTKRKVALKVMLDGPFAGPASKRRFEREVELVGSLRHRGIVPIFDSGTTHGNYFFVMEYVRGETLNHYVRNKNLSIKEILRLFCSACEAMAYAHQKGVIHRDLKPSNILVDESGEPRIVDFGLAKVGGAEADRDQSQLVSVTGQVMGTPAYMSPEQASGSPDLVDMRSDVYSLGIVLYELLTKRLPFDLHGSASENLQEIQFKEPVDPRAFNKALNHEVETIVLKAISKDRSRRYLTAGALAEDITRFLVGDPIEARRDSLAYLLQKAVAKHFAAMLVTVGMGLFFVAALITGWTLYWSGETARERLSDLSLDLTLERDTARELRSESQNQLYFAHMNLAAQALGESGGIGRVEELTELWMPDGDPAVSPVGWEWFYLRSRCDLEREVVAVEKSVWSAAFSPDGKYFASGGDSCRLSVYRTENPAEDIDLGTHTQHIRAIAWSPDNRWLASGSTDGSVFVFDTQTRRKIHTFSIDDQVLALAWHPAKPVIAIGSRNRNVTFGNAETGATLPQVYVANESVQAINYSPDGKLLVIGTWSKRGSLEVWDLESGSRKFDVDRKQSIFAVKFSPNGEYLATADSSGTLVVSKTSKLKNGKPVWTRNLERPIWAMAWSPDGNAVATAGEDRLIQVWNATTGDPIRTLEGHTGPIWALDWSHDGQTILTGAHDRTLRLWNVHSTTQDRIFVPQPNRRPTLDAVSWQPNGRNIAVAGAAHEVFVVDQSTGERIADLKVGIRSNFIDWSPDGSRIVAAHDTGVSWWNLSSPATTHTVDELTGLTLSAKWSPDGQQIAACGRTGAIKIWDVTQKKIVGSYRAPSVHCSVVWSPTADQLAVASFHGAKLIDCEDGTETILQDADDACRSVAWNPDGSQLAVGRDSGRITVHDAKTGESIHAMNEHVARVRCVLWHPDGSRLASASDDGTVRIWDPKTGAQTLLLRGHEGRVTGLDWSPDGQQLVAVGAESRIRIWDAAVGYETSDDQANGAQVK